jgi:acyl carrier protein
MVEAARVVAFINGPDCTIEANVGSDSSLIRSGLLDSLALFQLSLWIENEVGAPIDPDEIDLAEQWDTPADIARFIAAKRGRRR